jgi:hypothetical protein
MPWPCPPEPGRDLRERLTLAQVNQDEQGLLPGSSFRHRDPIAARCRRIIPATKDRVWRDSGSAAR